MSRQPSIPQQQQSAMITAGQTLTAVIGLAIASWSATLRFAVVSAALSLPAATGLALYLIVR